MKYRGDLIIIFYIAIMLLFCFIYKKTIVSLYGQHIPEIWASDFANMTFGEIYQKIGPPQEQASEKEYQNWLIHHWWGWQMLKMISSKCCQLTSKPTSIYYIVHVNYWYEPAYFKKIR